MKALDEYILMVVIVLLQNRDHVFANLCLIWTEKHGSERLKVIGEITLVVFGNWLRPWAGMLSSQSPNLRYPTKLKGP